MTVGDSILSAAKNAVPPTSGAAVLFGSSGSAGSFGSQIRPASWRGVPFVVLSAESRFGRKKVSHEYPYRDIPWIEDMGRAKRRFNIDGFLVGDDIISQRQALIAACEQPGPGILVHGTYGTVTLDLIDLAVTEKWDERRYFEVTLSFEQGGQRIFPGTATSTGTAVATAGAAAHAAASTSFLSKALSALKSGAAVVKMAVGTVSTWALTAQTLMHDATSIYHAIAALPSTLGQFFGRGGISGVLGASNALSRLASNISGTATTTQSLGALAAVTRNTVTIAAQTVTSTASMLGL